VLTGKGLEAIKGTLLEGNSVEYGNELFDCIVQRVAVAARCQPMQKKLLVLLFMETCDYTAFIGDGANDTAALKAADIGLSLTTNAEASVAAPFTSAEMEITSIITVLREGRAALANNFALFRFMALYAWIQFSNSVQAQLFGSYPGEYQFMYVDLLLVLPLCFIAPMTESFHMLSSRRVASSLLDWQIVVSVTGQAIICLVFQIAARSLVWSQCWYQSLSFQMCPNPTDAASTITSLLSNATQLAALGIPAGSFDVDALSAAFSAPLAVLAESTAGGLMAVNNTVMGANVTAQAQAALLAEVWLRLADWLVGAFPKELNTTAGCVGIGCQVVQLPPPDCPGFAIVSPVTCKDPKEFQYTPGYQGSALWHMCAFQYLFMIVIFAGGPPFRKPFYTNLLFVAVFVILFILTCLILLLAGGWVDQFFEFVKYPPDANFKWRLFGLCLTSGMVSALLEFCVASVDTIITHKREAARLSATLPSDLDLLRRPCSRRLLRVL
jgi:hypothetical protein